MQKREYLILSLVVFVAVFAILTTHFIAADDNGSTIGINNNSNGSTINTQLICCYTYGYGAYMKKVNEKYELMSREDCTVPQNFVGGGKEIVSDELCSGNSTITCVGEGESLGAVVPGNNKQCCQGLEPSIPEGPVTGTRGICVKINGTTSAEIEIHDKDTNRTIKVKAHSEDAEKLKEAIQERNRLKLNSSQLPENCTVTGVAMKCDINGSRTMIVFAGKSGNVIIQVKGINATIDVQLYKDVNGTLYGMFNNNETKIINLLPDDLKNLIMEKTNATISQNDTNVTLNNDGQYEFKSKKEAKLFGLFKMNEDVSWNVDPENGTISNAHTPWWGFLVSDVKKSNNTTISG